MWVADAYHWLEAQGLWTGTMYAATGTATVGLISFATLRLKKIHPFKLAKEHVHQQQRIADALDTTTPGGLTELVQTMNKEKA